MSYSVDSSLEDIMGDDAARGIMDKLYPIDTKSMNYKMSKRMSLRAIAKYPQSKLPEGLLSQIDEELKSIG